MKTNRLYITCPVCGKATCKASFLAQIEVKCHTCKSELLAEVGKEQKVTVEVLKEGKPSVSAI